MKSYSLQLAGATTPAEWWSGVEPATGMERKHVCETKAKMMAKMVITHKIAYNPMLHAQNAGEINKMCVCVYALHVPVRVNVRKEL